MQQIVSQLIFAGAEGVELYETSPWFEKRQLRDKVHALYGAQTHRRLLKSHLPLDCLVYEPRARYVCVLRDGRDTMWSWHGYLARATPYFYEFKNAGDDRVGPPLQRPGPDPRVEFLRFLDHGDDPSRANSPFWEYVRGWWGARNLPNLLLVHFADLKADMEGQIRRTAAFLDIHVPDALWPTILEHCSFEYMKKHSAQMSPQGSDALYEKGSDSFVNKGTNGRWRDVLSEEDIQRYEKRAVEELGQECADWLAHGS